MFENLLPPMHRHWSRREWVLTLAVAVGLWVIYAFIGPGIDYYGAYTWMVNNPEMYPLNAQRPWTLNPTWMVPFMAPFITLPGRAGYLAFMAATLAMMIFGAYVFGGRPIPLLLSAQMWWVLWWGQLEGWGVLGLVLCWLAMQQPVSWGWMFLGLTMASFKPQVSFVPALFAWWQSGRRRWASAALLLGVALLSVLIWGPWPLWYWQGLQGFVGDQHAGPWNASLGWVALPLFVPALGLPLRRDQRLLALTATALLVSPYLPYYSTIVLLCFNLPVWLYVFAFTGYLTDLLGTRLAWNALALLPLLTLAWLYFPLAQRAWQRWKDRRS